MNLPEPVVAVAAGHHHTLCVGRDGGVWAFGDNSQFQLGLGKKASTQTIRPEALLALAGVKLGKRLGTCWLLLWAPNAASQLLLIPLGNPSKPVSRQVLIERES